MISANPVATLLVLVCLVLGAVIVVPLARKADKEVAKSSLPKRSALQQFGKEHRLKAVIAILFVVFCVVLFAGIRLRLL